MLKCYKKNRPTGKQKGYQEKVRICRSMSTLGAVVMAWS